METSPQIYLARFVVPVSSPPIENGYVSVADGRITEVGVWAGGSRSGVIDFGDAVLLPGFVNAHAHLELTCYAGRIPASDLLTWIGKLIALRREPGRPEREAEAVRQGAEQSLRAGVTTIGDISRTHLAWPVLKSMPLRKICFAELLCFAEEPARNVKELIDKVHETVVDDRLTAGISPHAPYSVTGRQLRDCVDLARRHRLPLSMHVAESREERQYVENGSGTLFDMLTFGGYAQSNPPPRRPLFEYLGGSGLFNAPALLAHVNYPEDAELARLAHSPCSVAYCPRAHRFFGHEPHRFIEMLDRGIKVCIGTDSQASNETLSILDEMRFLHSRNPSPAPEMLLTMGTLNGARALQMQAQVGSLESGKRADFAVVPYCADVPSDPVVNLLESTSMPSFVFVDGRSVF